ncbi:hypothetical protein FIU88_05275 [Halomonas sp. THAF12]|uniref:DUF3455 domain-containing protein n=1 Tax=Halomonas TaxID=2745 RepID=UPI000311C2CB|nr:MULTISPECIES: DUF3455 domain-containing protein [Halomonas]QFT84388.1 hypothetical protein FIU88_05275 [Halomonas sp. THAF12]
MNVYSTQAGMGFVVAMSMALGASSAFAGMEAPEEVAVPAGNTVFLETVGKGEITYACETREDGAMGWVFKGPDAMLMDGDEQVGSYYGPPATWEASDGSKITGTQLATAPGGDGNIPFQLVEANPAMGEGAMTGVTYVQRLNTQGGVAPDSACSADNAGATEIVNYQADYLFWKAS